MSLATARVVDIHAHAILEETFGRAGAWGPELSTEADGTPVFRVGDYQLRGVRYRGSPFMDPDLRVAAMDRVGIDWQLLSPNPLSYLHFITAADAVAFCRAHNDALASVVARYPDRLGGAAALPMQSIPGAIEELRRAVGELGLRAAYIGTDLQHSLDDPVMDDFYEAVAALDVPLFLHPAPAGIDGASGAPALNRYELDIVCGFCGQETAAVATLLYGGVLHRHPTLDICVSHGGGAVALIWGRLLVAAEKRPWAVPHLKDGGAARQLARLWYDVHMGDARAAALLAERVGTERLVWGTNFAGWDAPEAYAPPRLGVDLADNARRLLRG